MTLIVDRLRRLDQSTVEARRMLADHVPVYEVSNVVTYLAAQGVSWMRTIPDEVLEDEPVDLTMFPNVGPPHDLYWMEWARPDRLMHDLYPNPPDRVAIVFGVQSSTADAWTVRAAVWAQWGHRPYPQATWELTFTKNGWARIVESKPFVDAHEQWGWGPRVPGVQDQLDAAVAEMSDELSGLPHDEALALLRSRKAVVKDEVNRTAANLDRLLRQTLELTVLFPALMAHSLLACRNVQVADHQPPVKLSRRSERKHKVPLVVFKTLQIDPAGGRARPVSGSGYEVLDDRRLHIARGHFKTFTEERPLFGRRVGTYWWAPQLRGNADHGAVVKDYRVTN